MKTLFPPVSERDHCRGPRNAPVVLVEYGDFQCPFCADASLNIERLQAEMGDELCFVFRNFPLTTIHDQATLAASAAEAAGEQGRFWQMHDALFDNQALLGPKSIERFAVELDLDLAEFRQSLMSNAVAQRIREDFMSGARSGVSGTPAFFVNGQKYTGLPDVATFRDLIHAA